MAFNTSAWLLTALLLLPTASIAAKQQQSSGGRVLYKYVDESGALVIKDYLPPEVVPKGYSIVNAYGQTLEVVPPVKTKEELAEEKKLKKQREAEERARREAARRDADLIRQFTRVEDIMRARDTQLSAIDVQISIRNGQTNLLTTQLEDMQRHAADYERRGQPVPAQLQKDIRESQRQMEENKKFVDIQEQEKARIAERFRQDIIRFKELQAARVIRQRDQSDGEGLAETTAVHNCGTAEMCRKAWQLAQIYARDNATRSLEIVTDSLILTGKALGDRDISLSFSMVPERDNTAQIVLEVSCNASDAGNQLCQTERVRNIVDGFGQYLASRLQ